MRNEMRTGFLYLIGRATCVIFPGRQSDLDNGILQLMTVEICSVTGSRGRELLSRPKWHENNRLCYAICIVSMCPCHPVQI